MGLIKWLGLQRTPELTPEQKRLQRLSVIMHGIDGDTDLRELPQELQRLMGVLVAHAANALQDATKAERDAMLDTLNSRIEEVAGFTQRVDNAAATFSSRAAQLEGKYQAAWEKGVAAYIETSAREARKGPPGTMADTPDGPYWYDVVLEQLRVMGLRLDALEAKVTALEAAQVTAPAPMPETKLDN